MLKKKIGYLGGSFDPIHFGHLNLALEALEKLGLDEVWFCPTAQSPLKKGAPSVEIGHRIKMLELSLERIPQFRVILNEAYNKSPPYTLDTLTQLKLNPENKDKDFFLILAEDLLSGLGKWHKIEILLEQFPLFIGTRKLSAHSLSLEDLDPFIIQKVKNKIYPIRTLEISSTDLKERLKKRVYCGHLLPWKVLDYIYQNELY